jgi:hypothetical protein
VQASKQGGDEGEIGAARHVWLPFFNLLAASVSVVLPFRPALAAAFDTGSDVQIRWDNTVRTTLGLRTAAQDPALLANINADDGDRAFAPGVNSERIDLLSELDISKGDLGLELSAAFWYDAVYHQPSANHSAATFNPLDLRPTQFPTDVRVLQGGSADLLNAYVHDKATIGGLPVTVRVGRQTLLWGESLFSTENGIAAGQAPVDDIKALSEPLADARELFLPVAQADIDVRLMPGVHAEVYAQGEWRRDRTPGVASYFSTEDFADTGGQRLFVGNGYYLRGPDRTPPGLGQVGAALHVNTGALDLGLYALRFDAKSPEFTITPGAIAGSAVLGRYGLIFPRGIGLYGASFSTYLGDSSLAGEVSLRTNMPLVSRLPLGAVAPQSAPYAAGNSLHAQLSTITTLPPSRLWQGATLLAEITANDRLAINHDPAALAPGRDRFATAFRATFAPQYFEVLPRLDLTVQTGIGWNILGSSSILPGEVARTGSASIGVDATFHVVWQFAVTYTNFIGAPTRNPLADRDFLSISASRTF